MKKNGKRECGDELLTQTFVTSLDAPCTASQGAASRLACSQSDIAGGILHGHQTSFMPEALHE
jgi:hypothetical protein